MAESYSRLIDLLGNFGQVLTEHIGLESIEEEERATLTDPEIYHRDMEWLRDSDLVIAEVSVPSLGVGFEIGQAIEMKKPVLCLFNEGSESRLSAMITGCPDVSVVNYKGMNELEAAVSEFISRNAGHQTP